MDDEFFFRVDQLPTNEDVFEFVNSRTRYGKMSRSLALNEMASAVHSIWLSADACPLTHNPIIERGKKLLRDRQDFLTRFKKNAQPKPSYPKTQQSESTKKRRFPSTGRDTSKRRSTSIYKRTASTQSDDSSIEYEVKEVMENLLEQIPEDHKMEKKEPLRKITLRNDCNAEQKWQKEVGVHLFDVFSDLEKKKAEEKGMAFDEEFLCDQRGPRKLFIDTTEVTKEFETNELQRKERLRRQMNNRASAIGDFSSVTFSATDSSTEVFQEYVAPQQEVSQTQFISGVKTRAEKANEMLSVLRGNSKQNVGTQTEAEFVFPQVSTRLPSSKNPGKISNQLNPRILAAGSLLMGIAGVTTKQAIISIKIVANVVFFKTSSSLRQWKKTTKK